VRQPGIRQFIQVLNYFKKRGNSWREINKEGLQGERSD
jgi:hypothetical protein